MSHKQMEEKNGADALASGSEQVEHSNAFNQMFATLEAEHQKLKQLEQRRLKLTKEMKNLREMLQLENRRLHRTINGTEAEPEAETETKVVNFTAIDWDALVGDETDELEQSHSQHSAHMIVQMVNSSQALEQNVCITQAPTIWSMPVSSDFDSFDGTDTPPTN